MKSLSIDTLTLSYDGFPALRNVSLDVARGSFVALLGPSGCGKTSLLRCVAGFNMPDSGRIRLDGADITAVPARRRRMGMVFQSYALFPHMTALENVCFGLESQGTARAEARRRATATLELVGLAAQSGKRPRQLSGGQQQRVALARALAIEPEVLLLDEPLGALDRKLRIELQGELKALQVRLGVTTLMVTHDQEEAFALADRVAAMRSGCIEQYDTPATLFRRPATAWVAEFIGGGSVVGLHEARRGLVFEGEQPPCDAPVFLPADRVALMPAAGGSLQVVSIRYLGRGYEVEAQDGPVRLRSLQPESAVETLRVGAPVRGVVAPGGWHALPHEEGQRT